MKNETQRHLPRLLRPCLLLCLAAGLLFALALTVHAERAAAGSGACGSNVNWTLYDDGELVISGAGAMNGYSNPSNVPWYGSRGSITRATISAGVTSIGQSVFCDCTNLTAVTIPASVTSIGELAFYGCTGLTGLTVAEDNRYYRSADGVLLTWNEKELIQYPAAKAGPYTVPDTVISIGQYAFDRCTGLTGVTIPNSVTSIGQYAFRGCTGLTDVVIPNSVTAIGDRVFEDCIGLTGLVLGTGVRSIGNCAFLRCVDLTDVTIPDSVTSVGDSAFFGCISLGSVTVGSGVTVIGYSTFQGCTWLLRVILPAGLTDVREGAFRECPWLKDVYFAGTQEQWDAIHIFANNDPLTGAARHLNAAGPVAVTGVTLDRALLALPLGRSQALTAAVVPPDAADRTVFWTSGDTAVASVGPDGTVTAVGVGTTTITAALADGGCPAACTVRVFDPAAVPTVTPGLVSARAGRTVEVPLTLAKNSGLAGAILTVTYDPALTLTAVSDGTALAGLDFTPPGDLTADPVNLIWTGTDAVDGNGTLAVLTFSVPAGTSAGLYGVSLSCQPDGCYDHELNDVDVVLFQGGVTVRDRLPGDLSGDDKVNAKDVTVLQRYLAGGYDVELEPADADLNHDGKANAKDVTLLQRFLAGGYDVTLD